MVDVADLVLERVPDDATAIGGLTMGADGVAFVTAAVAATRGRMLRAFSVRKEVKDHGGGGRLAGVLRAGDRVVIDEDTVTRGTSLLEAADVATGLGATVALVLPLVDRGGPARPWPRRGAGPTRRSSARPDLGFEYEGA